MEVKKIRISNPHGLHMRHAADVVQLAKKHKSRIFLCHNCKFADTCSILEILTLGAAENDELALIVDGPDEKEAIKNICELFMEKNE